MKDKVNREVKYREMWRPFCPSVTEEKAADYIENPKEARFMTVAYQMKENKKDKLPSVVHVDGSIRPQVVSKKANPLFHELITMLGKCTNHAVVLNTSFNVKGQPIICTPGDAIQCFYSCGLDALLLGDFLVEK